MRINLLTHNLLTTVKTIKKKCLLLKKNSFKTAPRGDENRQDDTIQFSIVETTENKKTWLITD